MTTNPPPQPPTSTEALRSRLIEATKNLRGEPAWCDHYTPFDVGGPAGNDGKKLCVKCARSYTVHLIHEAASALLAAAGREQKHDYAGDPKHCHACGMQAFVNTELRARAAESSLAALREALTAAYVELVATYGYDTPRVQPLFDKMDAALHAPSDPAASVDAGERPCSVCGRKHVNDVLRRLRSHCYECRRSDPDDEQTPSTAECVRCGELDCPHNEPLHYHHDGCPACIGDERCGSKAARIPLERDGALEVPLCLCGHPIQDHAMNYVPGRHLDRRGACRTCGQHENGNWPCPAYQVPPRGSLSPAAPPKAETPTATEGRITRNLRQLAKQFTDETRQTLIDAADLLEDSAGPSPAALRSLSAQWRKESDERIRLGNESEDKLTRQWKHASSVALSKCADQLDTLITGASK